MRASRSSVLTAVAVVAAVAICIAACAHFQAGPLVTIGALIAIRYLALAAIAAGTVPLCRARRMVAGDPTNPAGYYRLARALHQKEKVPDAIRQMRNVIQLDPSLEITQPRDAAEELVRRHGSRDRAFICEMCALACMDYLVEEARRESMKLKEFLSVCRRGGGSDGHMIAECDESIDSVRAEIAELESVCAGLEGPGADPDATARRSSIEKKIRWLTRLADEIAGLKRRIEDGEV